MARTLKPTPYHEAAAARAKAEAAAAKAEADAAAAKAKADAAAAKAKAGAAAKTGRQDRSPSLRRSKRTGTAKETTGGKAPRQQRAACACQPMADSRILPSASGSQRACSLLG